MDPIKRALGYPYDLMPTSYLLIDQQVYNWPDSFDLTNRAPVLACGSNQSPTQLARKFPTGKVAVMAGWLANYDSVYSAHFTTYGSIAATYAPCPNMRSRQMITWLDNDQLEIMHASEALGTNYEYVELGDIHFVSDDMSYPAVRSAFTYQSLHGPLTIGGPVALANIPAENRRFQALDQTDLQKKVWQHFEEAETLNDFVIENIGNAPLRKERTEKLKTIPDGLN